MPEEILFVINGLSTLWKIGVPYLLVLKTLIVQFWWIPVPFYLWHHLEFIYDIYISDKWDGDKTRKRVVLEVHVPQTIIRPWRAMEVVFNSIWGSYDPPKDWRASHFEGKKLLGAAFEIVGIDGVPHFFIRLPASNRKLFESAIYAQYPEVEIVEVADYTRQVPENIPNKEWDLWGADFEIMKPACYPIKTYEQFYEERPEVIKEEKRIDPLSHLFEEISRMAKGEQLWIQIFAMPKSPREAKSFYDLARSEIDKLVKRPEKLKQNPLWLDFWNLLIHGEPPKTEAEKEEGFLPPEMKLTSGERDIVTAIERKKSKMIFHSYIKFVYVAQRKVFFSGAKGYGTSFFSQFGGQSLNNLKPWTASVTKIQTPAIFSARRLYLRKRDLLENYRTRDPAFDPFPVEGAMYWLNTEEMATLWHFPSADAVPSQSLKRVEMKKGAPPSSLPVE